MKNWFLVIICLLFFMEKGITQQFSLDPVYLDLKAKADTAYKNEDYNLCAECYEKAASYTPDHYWNWYRAARCSSKDKQYKKAEQNLIKAIRLDWDLSEYMINHERNDFERLKRKKRCWRKVKKAIETGKREINFELRDEIFEMRENIFQTQLKMSQLNFKKDSIEIDIILKEKAEIEIENFKRLEEIIAEYGFPGKSMVGSTATTRVLSFLNVELFREAEKYIPMLWKSAENGELERKYVAGMVDLIEVLKGRPQIYGTQYYPKRYGSEFKGILDGKKVNQRRATVGLEPMSEIDKPFVVGYKYKRQELTRSDFKKFQGGWDLVNIRNAETFEITFLPEQNFWVEFRKKGKMRFNKSANTCEIAYKATDRGRLIFSPVQNCTKKCCDDLAITKKLRYQDVIEFEQYGNLMFLIDSKGGIWEFKRKVYPRTNANKNN